jgi:hypothetical protein
MQPVLRLIGSRLTHSLRMMHMIVVSHVPRRSRHSSVPDKEEEDDDDKKGLFIAFGEPPLAGEPGLEVVHPDESNDTMWPLAQGNGA